MNHQSDSLINVHYDVEPNKIYNWCNTDSQELYTSNVIKQFERLQKFNWINTKIDYIIDSDGLRNPPYINISQSYIALGCSFTFGVGVHYNDIWHQVLSKKLNIPIFNGGTPGGSADSSFRILYELIEKYGPPKGVIHWVPHYGRLEYIGDDDQPCHYGPWCVDQDKFKGLTKWSISQRLLNINRYKNLAAIKNICDSYNILNVNILMEDEKRNDQSARDLMHPGVLSHQSYADRFYKLINTV